MQLIAYVWPARATLRYTNTPRFSAAAVVGNGGLVLWCNKLMVDGRLHIIIQQANFCLHGGAKERANEGEEGPFSAHFAIATATYFRTNKCTYE